MFRGVTSIAIDAKGRLAIPSRYRDRLVDRCEGNLVITVALSKDIERQRGLAAYPLPDWEVAERKLLELPTYGPDTDVLQTLLTGYAHECRLDGQGRLLIPTSLREFASLEKQVRLIGRLDRFEVWDEGVWESRHEQMLASVGRILANPSEAIQNL